MGAGIRSTSLLIIKCSIGFLLLGTQDHSFPHALSTKPNTRPINPRRGKVFGTKEGIWSFGNNNPRRQFLSLAVVLPWMVANRPAASHAVANPLTLKGSFWETGELYEKSKQAPISLDPEDLLAYCQDQVLILKSLSDVAIQGDYEQLKKLLRGGAMSETQLRKRAYALVDQIVSEEDDYLAEEALRNFWDSWDSLDRTVDGASKLSVGGVAETLGLAVLSPYNAANQVARISSTGSSSSDGDPRFLVLAALDKATANLATFVGLAKKAFK